MQARRNGTAYAPARKNIGNDFACRGIVACADCNVPLRSSWPKGRNRHHAYYLCQTKGCAQYGKSIPRERLEGEVGNLIRSLQPTPGLFAVARAMFAAAWHQRSEQAAEILRAGQRQVEAIDKQVETLLSRILDASNPTVIRSYESKVSELELQKLVLAEQTARQAEPQGRFEDQLEPALTFVANPYKLWETGHITLRRTVLKLAFADRLKYDRNQGTRTPEIALPFRALGRLPGVMIASGADDGT